LLIDALKHPFSPFLPIMPFGQAVSTRHMPLATFYFPLTLCASRLAAFHSKRASAGQIARLARYLILLNSCKKYPPNVFSALSLLSQKAFRKRQQKFTVAGLCLRKFLQRLGLLNAETGGS
jgi:hypothetical protein